MPDRAVSEAGSEFVPPDTPIDLTNCDREPIHIPGAIQPHGALVAIDENTGLVRMASASTFDHLKVRGNDAVGMSVKALLGPSASAQLEMLSRGDDGRRADVLIADAPGIDGVRFDATVHRSGTLVVVELEPEISEPAITTPRLMETMRAGVSRLEGAESLGDIAQGIATEMRDITGFDRVWVYRFHADWHGEIIGEAKRDDIETWLGMHYPASDIPVQARALFLKNWLRVIPDVGFLPSPLEPRVNPLDGQPLDLGNSILRSVSPIHVQYLKNMGVTASLVISLIHRGKLWGLISGHHYSGPKRVPYSTRVICEFLARALSLQVGVTDRLIDREHALEIRARLVALIEQLGADEFQHALTRGRVTLTDLADATGAAVIRKGVIFRTGIAPTDEQIRALSAWISEQSSDAIETDALSRSFPPASEYRSVASGLLAMTLSRDHGDQLLWFRGERRQTVRWAGDPRKPVTRDASGAALLQPRGSFELWEEEVQGTAVAWEPIAIEMAQEIRRAVLDTLIRQAEETQRINEELTAMNVQLQESAIELETQAEALLEQRELREQLLEREQLARRDADLANRAKSDFLAVMSHELRTPLNAIGGHSDLMAMGLHGAVTPEQLGALERIKINQRHLLGIINSILNFSKLEAGAVSFVLVDVQVAPLLKSLDALIGPQIEAKALRLTVGACADTVVVRADEEKLRQILLNLLTNALKFTASGGDVQLSCGENAGRVEIRVRDTGIGIPTESLHAVFEPFVQIERTAAPVGEQGVGLGLSISRELARGMGGELTVVSKVGEGSTFILTLPSASGTA